KRYAQLAAIPRHVGMIPAIVGKLQTISTHARPRIKIAPLGNPLHSAAGSVNGNEAILHRLAMRFHHIKEKATPSAPIGKAALFLMCKLGNYPISVSLVELLIRKV